MRVGSCVLRPLPRGSLAGPSRVHFTLRGPCARTRRSTRCVTHGMDPQAPQGLRELAWDLQKLRSTRVGLRLYCAGPAWIHAIQRAVPWTQENKTQVEWLLLSASNNSTVNRGVLQLCRNVQARQVSRCFQSSPTELLQRRFWGELCSTYFLESLTG